ncbi:MAG: hypothetical protein OJF49_001691 [Ktedonobacterales bacterium]|nr:MAG: hypothetical protein OJF49_001691 [Ktedonobacterales bacterium]
MAYARAQYAGANRRPRRCLHVTNGGGCEGFFMLWAGEQEVV